MEHLAFAIIAAIIAAISGFLAWTKRRGASNWPMITGVVEQTCVDQDNRGHVPGLLYSYQVNGEYYSGQFSFPDGFRDRDKALESVKPWLQKKIYIRYKPSDPQISVLLPNDRPPV